MSEQGDELQARIEHDFAYHKPPNAEVAERHAKVRDYCRGVAIRMVELVPQGRELSVALTKIEEAMFWANAGIARNPTSPPALIPF